MKSKPRHPAKNLVGHPHNSTLSCGIIGGSDSPCCAILESIGEGVFTVDLKKRITFFNPTAEKITGFSVQEAIGQYCFDVFRSDLCETRCPLDRSLAGDSSELNPRGRIIDKSGEQKTVSITTSAIRDRDGRIIGGVETFRDLSELEELRRQVNRRFTPHDIVGKHPSMRKILAFLPDIARSDSPALIYGPTGSGKELIARAIHTLSSRSKGPFVPVNCAALPDSLLESELFGYARGAFTGAMRNKPGRFLLANRGTLFLDEIGNTSMAFQADLLRVLEDGEFTPLGETKPIKADFRVVTATNLDLKKRVQEEKFRDDLYYRLNVVRISLPPLNQRKEDIPLLVDHFIHKFNLLKGCSIRGMTPEALAVLVNHSFPGNIRELENIIEFAFISCKSGPIERRHLPADLLEAAGSGAGKRPESVAPGENSEARKIISLLERYGGNRIQTARALGMSRTTLWRKLKKYGLENNGQQPKKKGN